MRPSRLLQLASLLLAVAACKPESARRAERAAEEVAEARKALREEGPVVARPMTALADAGRLAKAEREFRSRRDLRIQVLRGEHSVIALQRDVISAMAKSFTMSDEDRAAVNAELTVFARSIAETQNVIDGLEHVDASAWVERQDQAVEAMTHLDDVRAKTWHALDVAVKATRNAT